MSGSFTAFFQAIAGAFKVAPIFILNHLENEIENIDDEIFDLSINADPFALLRIEQLTKRKSRKDKLVGAIRSAVGDAD